MQLRQFVPALFISALAISLVSWCLSPKTKLAFLALGGLYLIFVLAGSVMIAARTRKWRLLPLLPAALATLHFAYGTGFIAGLVRFWNRWKIAGAQCELGYEPAEK
jgi:fucose 4-O-acetylase-like acetyltransferase